MGEWGMKKSESLHAGMIAQLYSTWVDESIVPSCWRLWNRVLLLYRLVDPVNSCQEGPGLSHQDCTRSSALFFLHVFRQTYFPPSLHAPHSREQSCYDLPRQPSLGRHSFIILWLLSQEIRLAGAGPRLFQKE